MCNVVCSTFPIHRFARVVNGRYYPSIRLTIAFEVEIRQKTDIFWSQAKKNQAENTFFLPFFNTICKKDVSLCRYEIYL